MELFTARSGGSGIIIDAPPLYSICHSYTIEVPLLHAVKLNQRTWKKKWKRLRTCFNLDGRNIFRLFFPLHLHILVM